MIDAVRLRTRVNSETLHLPEVRPLIGKEVEIVVREVSHSGAMPERRLDNAEWHSRFDAMLADARRACQHLPEGYVAEDSREWID